MSQSDPLKGMPTAEIFPRSHHLKLAMYTSCILGIWPLVHFQRPIQRLLYNSYFKLALLYFNIFIVLSIIKLVSLAREDKNDVSDIISSLSVSLPAIMSAIRVWVLRKKEIRRLIRKILAMDQFIMNVDDDEVIQIYKDHTKQNWITGFILVGNVVAEVFVYLIKAAFTPNIIEVDENTNKTTVIRALPLLTWFPYDEQKHYIISYLIHSLDGAMTGLYFISIDVLNFSMITYILAQMQILIHIFNNFHKYVSRVEDQLQCSREEASFITLRECVLKHKYIISFLNEYNNCMKSTMLLDFLQSSLHLASITTQLFMEETHVFNTVNHVEFAICMLLRLFIYYWYANEVIVQSTQISTAVFEIFWFDEPRKVKQMMQLIIMRANKALGLDISSFGTMSLNTFLQILKTTYSYMSIIVGK